MDAATALRKAADAMDRKNDQVGEFLKAATSRAEVAHFTGMLEAYRTASNDLRWLAGLAELDAAMEQLKGAAA